MTFLDRLMSAMEQSTLTQFTLAVTLTLTICYLACTEKQIPALLAGFAGSVYGFYYRGKQQERLQGLNNASGATDPS